MDGLHEQCVGSWVRWVGGVRQSKMEAEMNGLTELHEQDGEFGKLELVSIMRRRMT